MQLWECMCESVSESNDIQASFLQCHGQMHVVFLDNEMSKRVKESNTSTNASPGSDDVRPPIVKISPYLTKADRGVVKKQLVRERLGALFDSLAGPDGYIRGGDYKKAKAALKLENAEKEGTEGEEAEEGGWIDWDGFLQGIQEMAGGCIGKLQGGAVAAAIKELGEKSQHRPHCQLSWNVDSDVSTEVYFGVYMFSRLCYRKNPFRPVTQDLSLFLSLSVPLSSLSRQDRTRSSRRSPSATAYAQSPTTRRTSWGQQRREGGATPASVRTAGFTRCRHGEKGVARGS